LNISHSRSAIIARILLYGFKISQALSLNVDDLDFINNTVIMHNKKISINPEFMKELDVYINQTAHLRINNQFVFVTRNSTKVHRNDVSITFIITCKFLKLEIISPEDLRYLIKKFKKQGYSELEVLMAYKYT